jgi:hypothetical protein
VGKAKKAYRADMNTKLKRTISGIINTEADNHEIISPGQRTGDINPKPNALESIVTSDVSPYREEPFFSATSYQKGGQEIILPLESSKSKENEIPDDEYFRLLNGVYEVLPEFSGSKEKKVLKEVFSRIPGFEGWGVEPNV